MRPYSILALALILLVASGLRVHRLADDSVWWDEGFSVWMGRMPIMEMLDATAHDAHPPLSYGLLHGWRLLVGEEEYALRMLSVFFGVLTAALAYQLGRESGGRREGLAAAVLVATARLPVWWSQEIRMYTLAALLAALSLWATLRLFAGRGQTWIWVLTLAVSSGLGLLTLYLYVGVLLAQNIALIYAFAVSKRRWRLLIHWAAGMLGALLIFLPWLLYALPRLPSWAAPQAPVDLLYVVKLYLGVIFLGIATAIEHYALLLVLCLVVLIGASILSLLNTRRRGRPAWVLLAICTVLPILLVYLLSLPRGQFNYPTPSPRYFLLLSTPTYVLVAWGALVVDRRRPGIGTLIVASLAGLFLWSLSLYYPGLHLHDDYQSMAATLEALRRPGDVVVLHNDTDWPLFAYHYPSTFDRIPHAEPIGDEKYAATLLEHYEGKAEGVWLVQTQYAEASDPADQLGQWLRRHAWNWRTYVFPEGQLWFCALTPERGDPNTVVQAVGTPSALQPVHVPITPGVTLTGFIQPLYELRAGNLAVIGLMWHVEQDISGEWTAAVKVVDRTGEELSSTPVTLEGLGLFGSEDRFLPVEIFIPPDTPAGPVQIVFVAGETWQPLDTLYIYARSSPTAGVTALPDSAIPLDVRFGENILLLGVDLPARTTFAPGESIPLVVYWQAAAPVRERYKVFVHLVGQEYNERTDNTVWGQQDQEPRGGAATTTTWRPGEIIADDYLITIAEDTPPGIYRIEIGLYLPLGGTRLPATGAPDRVLGDRTFLMELQIAP